eukprot:g1107.t1
MMVCGIILLVVGTVLLVMGGVFPNMVKTQYENGVADLLTTHDKAAADALDAKKAKKPDPSTYESWLRNGSFDDSASTYDYYLPDVQNKDAVLFQGAAPKIVDKGPYRILAYSKKYGESFSGDDVTYKTKSSYKYDASKSCAKSKHKSNCVGLDDEVTVINPAYLGLMKATEALEGEKILIPVINALTIGAGAPNNIYIGQKATPGLFDNGNTDTSLLLGFPLNAFTPSILMGGAAKFMAGAGAAAKAASATGGGDAAAQNAAYAAAAVPATVGAAFKAPASTPVAGAPKLLWGVNAAKNVPTFVAAIKAGLTAALSAACATGAAAGTCGLSGATLTAAVDAAAPSQMDATFAGLDATGLWTDTNTWAMNYKGSGQEATLATTFAAACPTGATVAADGKTPCGLTGATLTAMAAAAAHSPAADAKLIGAVLAAYAGGNKPLAAAHKAALKEVKGGTRWLAIVLGAVMTTQIDTEVATALRQTLVIENGLQNANLAATQAAFEQACPTGATVAADGKTPCGLVAPVSTQTAAGALGFGGAANQVAQLGAIGAYLGGTLGLACAGATCADMNGLGVEVAKATCPKGTCTPNAAAGGTTADDAECAKHTWPDHQAGCEAQLGVSTGKTSTKVCTYTSTAAATVAGFTCNPTKLSDVIAIHFATGSVPKTLGLSTKDQEALATVTNALIGKPLPFNAGMWSTVKAKTTAGTYLSISEANAILKMMKGETDLTTAFDCVKGKQSPHGGAEAQKAIDAAAKGMAAGAASQISAGLEPGMEKLFGGADNIQTNLAPLAFKGQPGSFPAGVAGMVQMGQSMANNFIIPKLLLTCMAAQKPGGDISKGLALAASLSTDGVKGTTSTADGINVALKLPNAALGAVGKKIVLKAPAFSCEYFSKPALLGLGGFDLNPATGKGKMMALASYLVNDFAKKVLTDQFKVGTKSGLFIKAKAGDILLNGYEEPVYGALGALLAPPDANFYLVNKYGANWNANAAEAAERATKAAIQLKKGPAFVAGSEGPGEPGMLTADQIALYNSKDNAPCKDTPKVSKYRNMAADFPATKDYCAATGKPQAKPAGQGSATWDTAKTTLADRGVLKALSGSTKMAGECVCYSDIGSVGCCWDKDKQFLAPPAGGANLVVNTDPKSPGVWRYGNPSTAPTLDLIKQDYNGPGDKTYDDLPKSTVAYISQAQRGLKLTYSKDVKIPAENEKGTEKKELKLRRFTANLANHGDYWESAADVALHTEGYTCALDMTEKAPAKAFLGHPHLTGCDKVKMAASTKYTGPEFDTSTYNPGDLSTNIDIEPHTGATMCANQRLGAYLVIDTSLMQLLHGGTCGGAAGIGLEWPFTEDACTSSKDIVVPYYWLNLNACAKPDQAYTLWSLLNFVRFMMYTLPGILFGVGGGLAGLGAILLAMSAKKKGSGVNPSA